MNTNRVQEARFGTDANVNVWDDVETDREDATMAPVVKDYSGGYVVR